MIKNEVIDRGDHLEIVLPSGSSTLISPEDQWIFIECLSVYESRGYARACLKTVNGKRSEPYLHRLIQERIENIDGKDVDHANQVRLDNRRPNLRSCDRSHNMANATPKKFRRSLYRGVSPSSLKSKPWRATSRKNGKQVHIGNFPTEREAALAWNDYAIKRWGEFTRLNKVE